MFVFMAHLLNLFFDCIIQGNVIWIVNVDIFLFWPVSFFRQEFIAKLFDDTEIALVEWCGNNVYLAIFELEIVTFSIVPIV